MFCPKCGKDIKEGSKFCKHCGSEIKRNSSSNNSPVVSNTSDDDKNKKIIIGVLIAVIVILTVVFVAFGLNLFNGESQTPDSAVQSGDAMSNSASSSKPVSLNSFPVSEAPALAQAIKDSNGNFPVQFQSLSLSKAQCLYILSKSIVEINNGNVDGSISVGDPAYASHPSGKDSSQSIARANYVDMSSRFSSWIESNGAVPNYVGIYTGGVPDVSPSKMLDICVHILINYGSSHNLPESINI